MQQQRRRNRFIIGVLSLGLLAGAALTATPAQAVDAVGPYYAEPAWDRKMAPVNRFVVLTNWASEAVLDKETGLVWEKSPTTTPTITQNWSAARFTCANKNIGGVGRKGWRLPSMPELASLVDPSVAAPGPTLPTGHPFLNVQSAFYWSASTFAENPSSAWFVNFSNGVVDFIDKSFSDQVWCVRGSMNADQY
jgi:hypothetical protein